MTGENAQIVQSETVAAVELASARDRIQALQHNESTTTAMLKSEQDATSIRSQREAFLARQEQIIRQESHSLQDRIISEEHKLSGIELMAQHEVTAARSHHSAMLAHEQREVELRGRVNYLDGRNKDRTSPEV